MKKTDKDLLIQEINKNAEKGHKVTKLYTTSHSTVVSRVECGCGNYHPVRDNSFVNWGVNLHSENATGFQKDNNPSGIHGAYYNNF